MDVETSEAIEQLGQRIDALEVSLGRRFDTVDARFDAVDAGFAESRRHTEVLFEALRDDIRMLAEGYAALTARLESDRR